MVKLSIQHQRELKAKDDEIKCLAMADYDEISGKIRRAAHLRISYPPTGVSYRIAAGKSYTRRVSHYSNDPISVILVSLRFLTEAFSFANYSDADIQHIFFWKRAKSRLPAVIENDQSLSQFLSSYVGIEGNLKEKARRLFLRLVNLKRVKAVIVWSEWGKMGFEQDGFPADKIKVIPPPLPSRTKRADTESERILFIGRDYRRKGGDIVLKVFIKLAKKFEKVELCYVGPIKDAGLLASARRTGRFTHYENPPDELLYEKIFPESSIFFLPSRSEAFGISIIEAMSFSLPIVTSDLPSLRENVKDGYNGILVQSEDQNAYKEALCNLLEDGSKRRRMGTNAKDFVIDKFSPFKVGAALKQVYFDSLG